MSRSSRRNAIKIDGFYSDSKKRKFTDSVRGVSRPLDVQWFESNLGFSYEEIYPPPKWPSHPKRKGYRPRNPAIIDLDQVPKGWSDLEPDLRPDDYEAQIERCNVRIKENIMPLIFEHRLERYEELQEEREELMGAKPGLRLEVVQRLGTLERINQWLESRDDEWEQIDNVLAIIAAYEDRTLRWNPRLVTYWSMGVQLCEPRPYDINEYLYLNGQYKGHTGFWVEGGRRVMPHKKAACRVTGPSLLESFANQVPIAIRCPTANIAGVASTVQPHMQFTFTDDTGCDVATLFARDIELLQANDVLRGGNGELPPSSGISEAFMANGELEYYVTRTLEFNMLEHETMQPMVDHWDAIDCHLNPGEEVPRQNARLLGPWLRNKLYTYTIPDSLFRTWIYNERPRGPLLQATPDEVRINLASIDADDINLFPEFDLRYPAGVP